MASRYNRHSFLNPVLSIPWGYRADNGNLRELRHLWEAAGIFHLDKKTGALDLTLKKTAKAKATNRKTVNETVNTLAKLHKTKLSSRKNNNSITSVEKPNRVTFLLSSQTTKSYTSNSSTNTDAISLSSSEGAQYSKTNCTTNGSTNTETISSLSDKAEFCKNAKVNNYSTSTETASFSTPNKVECGKIAQANGKTMPVRNRRKARKPQKSVVCENTNPLEDCGYPEYKSNILKLRNTLPRRILPKRLKRKIGVILRLRNHQYESTLL